jgi:hypothetical protein
MMMMMTIMKTLKKAEMAPKDFAIIKQAIWYLSVVTPAHDPHALYTTVKSLLPRRRSTRQVFMNNTTLKWRQRDLGYERER